MNIVIVADRALLPIDTSQLSRKLREAAAAKSGKDDVPAHACVCRLIGPEYVGTLALSDQDIVIVDGSVLDGLALSSLADTCRAAGAILVPATSLPLLRSDTPDVAYLSPSDEEVLRLARERRLRVLDLFDYALAWYERESEENRSAYLCAVKGGWRLTSRASAMITRFVARWLIRRYLDHATVGERLYGAAMYPELWDKKTADGDMAHAQRIGLNAMRIGEFIWSRIEPAEGQYDMAYLENLIKRYRDHGLKVILSVPTATPPRWFTLHYPDSVIVTADGTRMHHGSRQHVCTNDPHLRRAAYRLAHRIGKVAEKYRDTVVAIQLDNELKCHVDECFCDTCRRRWPQWLQTRYGTIGALNEAWGTNVFSEHYDSFADVVLPEPTPFAHNSSLDYAFRTFTADTVNEFAFGLAQTLIDVTSVPLTHNTSTNFNLRNYGLFDQLDVVGFDTYPNSLTPWMFPMNLALWRNLIPDADFMLMETCASHVGYTGNYALPHPKGFLTTEVFVGYASGLRSFLYWLYRGQRVGVEQPHSAIVTAAGTPDLGYDEVVGSAQMVRRMEPRLAATHVVRSSVAMVYSDEARRSFLVESGGIYNFKQMVTDFYHALSARGVDPELVPENADFSRYRCVIVPFVHGMSDELIDRCQAYVKAGGKLILGPMTGDRTTEMTWNVEDGNGLGRLGSWLGLRNIVQYRSDDPRTRAEVTTQDGRTDALAGLVTLFDADQTPDYLRVTSSIAGDRTAVGLHDGTVYIGGIPDPSGADTSAFWDEIVSHEILPYDADAAFLHYGGAVQAFRRDDDDHHADFYIANMAGAPADIILRHEAVDEDGAAIPAGTLRLGAFECRVLRFSAAH